MDESQPIRHVGGNLEPADRAAVLKSQLRLPGTPDSHRFELRDAFSEVTHRSSSFEEMVVKAERLGASRFTAIAPDGQRSEVAKQDGRWPDAWRDTPSPARPSPSTLHTPSPSAPTRSSANEAKAERAARVAGIEAQLAARYLIRHAPLRIGDVTIGQTEYRHRADASRIAFTESTFRLSTPTNSPSVARSMVDVAEARGWQAIRVSGSDDFRRMVWLEASLRSVKTIGYQPAPGDLEQLKRDRLRQGAEVARSPDQSTPANPSTPKQSGRGGSRQAVLAALEAVLTARHVPAAQRDAVMSVAAETLSRRLRNGERFRVKVYDKSAPSQRPPIVAQRDVTVSRERTPGR